MKTRPTAEARTGLARRAFIVGAATLPLAVQTSPGAAGEATAELQALISRCVELKAGVAGFKMREASLPAEAFEEEVGEAFQAMWDAEDQVNAFQPQSIEDLRLKAGFAIDHMYSDQSAEHGSDLFAWNVLRELAGRQSLPDL